MSQNIEIKAHFADLEKGRLKAEALGARFAGNDHQIDTYFKVERGRLKLRQSALSGNFLIPYLRPDDHSAKKSDYLLLPVENAQSARNLLAQMFGIRLIVEKERTIYLWENVRIHLDCVKGLGNFLEFEAVVDDEHSIETCQEQVQWLFKHFEIDRADLIGESYSDLLQKQAEK
ncbi:class IV adenylate cyclase [Calditrichota bacterium LG25]